jgi:hypothetical protein
MTLRPLGERLPGNRQIFRNVAHCVGSDFFGYELSQDRLGNSTVNQQCETPKKSPLSANSSEYPR